MHPFLCAMVAFAVAVGLPSSGAVEQATKPKEDIICDKQYKIVAPDDVKKDLGRYHIKATRVADRKQIRILEELTMDHKGKKIGYKSTVTYNMGPLPAPQEGKAETTVDGQVCMRGVVQFRDTTLSLSCLGLLNGKSGEKIDPPRQYEKKDIKKPKGVLVFQSALPAIGPLLIPDKGELKNVVFVEFPDDINAPELINLKKGYRLVRGEPDALGVYGIKIFAPHSEMPACEALFDKHGKLTTIPSFGKMSLVEVKRQPATLPRQ